MVCGLNGWPDQPLQRISLIKSQELPYNALYCIRQLQSSDVVVRMKDSDSGAELQQAVEPPGVICILHFNLRGATH